jgi:hypothetical protein
MKISAENKNDYILKPFFPQEDFWGIKGVK